jgi:hypothetical protein
LFGGAIIGAAVERAVLSDHVGADGFALESTTVPTFAVSAAESSSPPTRRGRSADAAGRA